MGPGGAGDRSGAMGRPVGRLADAVGTARQDARAPAKTGACPGGRGEIGRRVDNEHKWKDDPHGFA